MVWMVSYFRLIEVDLPNWTVPSGSRPCPGSSWRSASSFASNPGTQFQTHETWDNTEKITFLIFLTKDSLRYCFLTQVKDDFLGLLFFLKAITLRAHRAFPEDEGGQRDEPQFGRHDDVRLLEVGRNDQRLVGLGVRLVAHVDPLRFVQRQAGQFLDAGAQRRRHQHRLALAETTLFLEVLIHGGQNPARDQHRIGPSSKTSLHFKRL